MKTSSSLVEIELEVEVGLRMWLGFGLGVVGVSDQELDQQILFSVRWVGGDLENKANLDSSYSCS